MFSFKSLFTHKTLKIRKFGNHSLSSPSNRLGQERVLERCRKMAITEATFYNWKKKWGSLGVPQLVRLKNLEEENFPLKKLVGDLGLHKQILHDVLRPFRKRWSGTSGRNRIFPLTIALDLYDWTGACIITGTRAATMPFVNGDEGNSGGTGTPWLLVHPYPFAKGRVSWTTTKGCTGSIQEELNLRSKRPKKTALPPTESPYGQCLQFA